MCMYVEIEKWVKEYIKNNYEFPDAQMFQMRIYFYFYYYFPALYFLIWKLKEWEIKNISLCSLNKTSMFEG